MCDKCCQFPFVIGIGCGLMVIAMNIRDRCRLRLLFGIAGMPRRVRVPSGEGVSVSVCFDDWDLGNCGRAA